MRQCPCGGLVRQHDLSGNRQVWTCGSCGRREEFIQNTVTAPKWLTEKEKDELWLSVKINGQCLTIEAAMALIDAVEDAVLAKNMTHQ